MSTAGVVHPRSPNRPMKRILVAAGAWTFLVLALVGWWSWVLRKQADRIIELERIAGVSSEASALQWSKTHRMLVWESWTLVLLLLAVTSVLVWLYWRDARRTKSLQAFFASVTHELKTPLTSIRLQTESIADQGSSPELVERLLEDTGRLEGQVERTLELARLEGGGKVITQALPLKTWLERTLGYLGRSYGKRVDIEWSLKSQDPVVLADPVALQIIFRNLVENSVRYSGKSPVAIRVKAEQRDSLIVLEYDDNGRGFAGAPKSLGELFFRGDGSQGAGVGLYLVRALVERMGGRTQFESVSGKGFGVKCWLPAGE